eukprot:TRINITY_DN3358_c0_g1_i1.p1 TRINITY_DN3358_c0_g1~~TRINITY_DN3358_c0_g1_i1.p1  ORF type:complete len:303 (-),score=59.73 TRINITY_DN3358_c0_g1_i1:299-1207(-)
MKSSELKVPRKDTEQLAWETDAMDRRLKELRKVMDASKTQRATSGGRIWDSSAKTRGASREGTKNPGRAETPPMSLSTIPAARPVSEKKECGTDAEELGECEPMSPSLAPIRQPFPNRPDVAAFSLFAGDFAPEGQPKSFSESFETQDYIRAAHEEYTNSFREIEQYQYDELEAEREIRAALASGLTLEELFGVAEEPLAPPSPRQVAPVPQPVPAKPMPKAKKKAGISFGDTTMISPGAKRPQTAPRDSDMQTDAPVSEKWQQFTEGLSRATELRYFDHLVEQMEMQLQWRAKAGKPACGN